MVSYERDYHHSNGNGSSGPSKEVEHSSGFCGELFDLIRDLFNALNLSGKVSNDDSEETFLAQNEAGRFRIWGSGFDVEDGGLDELLDGSVLQGAVVVQFVGIARKLSRCMSVVPMRWVHELTRIAQMSIAILISFAISHPRSKRRNISFPKLSKTKMRKSWTSWILSKMSRSLTTVYINSPPSSNRSRSNMRRTESPNTPALSTRAHWRSKRFMSTSSINGLQQRPTLRW